MTISHLLPDSADIKRAARTYSNGQWSKGAFQTAASSVSCRVSLSVSAREVAIAGREGTLYDRKVYFDKATTVQADDELAVNGEALEVVKVVTNTGAPYVLALCRAKID